MGLGGPQREHSRSRKIPKGMKDGRTDPNKMGPLLRNELVESTNSRKSFTWSAVLSALLVSLILSLILGEQ